MIKFLLVFLLMRWIYQKRQVRRLQLDSEFPAKYAQQELLKFKQKMLPKGRLTHGQMAFRFALCYYLVSSYEWFPKN